MYTLLTLFRTSSALSQNSRSSSTVSGSFPDDDFNIKVDDFAQPLLNIHYSVFPLSCFHPRISTLYRPWARV